MLCVFAIHVDRYCISLSICSMRLTTTSSCVDMEERCCSKRASEPWGKREEGKREEGRGKRKEGRGKREEGRGETEKRGKGQRTQKRRETERSMKKEKKANTI